MLFKHRLPKPDPEAEEKFREEVYEHGGFEKSDVLAMILSAFIVIVPVALIVLALMCVVAFLFT